MRGTTSSTESIRIRPFGSATQPHPRARRHPVDRIARFEPHLARGQVHTVVLEPDPTFGLSLALHELATNASKHGALSAPDGRIDVAWSITRTQQGPTLVLDWKEIGGPTPKKTRRPGFGSRLINMVIERQLNGQVRQTFGADGLAAQLTVPLTHERWPGGTRAATSDLP